MSDNYFLYGHFTKLDFIFIDEGKIYIFLQYL